MPVIREYTVKVEASGEIVEKVIYSPLEKEAFLTDLVFGEKTTILRLREGKIDKEITGLKLIEYKNGPVVFYGTIEQAIRELHFISNNEVSASLAEKLLKAFRETGEIADETFTQYDKRNNDGCKIVYFHPLR